MNDLPKPPDDDAARLEARQAVIRRTLDLEAGTPVPFLVAPYNMWYATADILTDFELDLARQMAQVQAQRLVDDYSIPHLKPGTGLGTIPSAFGCHWHAVEDADPWIRPLIRDNPDDVYRLELPNPHSDGLSSLFFEKATYFQAHSDLPLVACNIPAPLTAASMIWDYSTFLLALMEHPRQVHHLLDLVTEYTIAFLRLQVKTIGNLLSLTHMNWIFPLDYGLRVSDDVLAVISPQQYHEFGLPYNNRLSREFGGIIVHSCGNIIHNIPTILETEGLRGITLTLPHNDIRRIAELAAGKTALMLRYWNFDWEAGRQPDDLVDFTATVLETLGTRGIMLEMQVPSATAEEAIEIAKRCQVRAWRSE